MATASSSSSNSQESKATPPPPQPSASTLTADKSPLEQASTSSLDEIREFVRIGRTGRRNAIADVMLDPNANVMSANSLSELMCKIDCGGTKENQS